VTICLQCGVEGLSDALIYCHNCLVFAIHRYCLLVLPATFKDRVIWYCEDCESKVHCYENHGKHQNSRRRRELDCRSSDEEAESLKTKTSWTTDGDNTSNPEQSRELHYDESDNKRRKRHVGLNGSSSDEDGESFKTKTSGTSVLPNIPQCGCYDHKQRIIESIIEVHCCVKDEKDQRRRRRGLDWVTSDEEAEFVEAKISPTSASQLSNNPNRCSYIPAEPIVKPIWNGCLSLSHENYGTVGLVAHLSSLACSKVVEEAKLLPWLLCLELLPRSDVWPQNFEKRGPSDDNIARFLFPNDEIEEMVYYSLVDDMINQDHAMKALVKNAELLVSLLRCCRPSFGESRPSFICGGCLGGRKLHMYQMQ
ncbi:hypothetical protein Ddye_005520, partial [Dipteronia dyeriana]